MRRSDRTLLSLLLLFASLSAASAPTPAPDQSLISSEQLSHLRAARIGDRVAIHALASSPRVLADFELTRVDLYAPGAKVYVVGPDGPREAARSTELQFVARTGPRVGLSLSADGKAASGVWLADDGNAYVLTGHATKDGLVLEQGRDTLHAPDGRELRINLDGSDDARTVPLGSLLGTNADLAPLAADATTTGTLQAVVAIDTDNEFMLNKFANNTTNATTYIAALFTAMNVIYGRDLNVVLLLGTSILRPSTTADPYSSTSSTSTSDQLDEFSEFWRTHESGVACAFAQLLSGKSSSANSSSGIAWILDQTDDNYCTETGTQFTDSTGTHTAGHFSLDRVFQFAGSTAANDVLVAAHELGHNFGANHTHCTDQSNGHEPVAANTIDQCFNLEAPIGCFGGTQVCPASHTVNGVTSVTGTLMSYCHLAGLVGCTSSLVFADEQRTTVGARVSQNVTLGCITSTVVNVVFQNSYE